MVWFTLFILCEAVCVGVELFLLFWCVGDFVLFIAFSVLCCLLELLWWFDVVVFVCCDCLVWVICYLGLLFCWLLYCFDLVDFVVTWVWWSEVWGAFVQFVLMFCWLLLIDVMSCWLTDYCLFCLSGYMFEFSGLFNSSVLTHSLGLVLLLVDCSSLTRLFAYWFGVVWSVCLDYVFVLICGYLFVGFTFVVWVGGCFFVFSLLRLLILLMFTFTYWLRLFSC